MSFVKMDGQIYYLEPEPISIAINISEGHGGTPMFQFAELSPKQQERLKYQISHPHPRCALCGATDWSKRVGEEPDDHG